MSRYEVKLDCTVKGLPVSATRGIKRHFDTEILSASPYGAVDSVLRIFDVVDFASGFNFLYGVVFRSVRDYHYDNVVLIARISVFDSGRLVATYVRHYYFDEAYD